MPFRHRDLVITVLPQNLDPEIFAEPCDAGSEHPPGGPPPGPDQISIFGRPDIQELRLQLQMALALAGGPLSAEEMRPRSAAELDALEKKLQDALNEVRRQRAQFR